MAKITPLIAVGVPTFSGSRVTMTWSRAYRHLGMPLGATMCELYVTDQPIAQARNALMAQAIAAGADFLFYLGDDVLPPGDAVIRLLHRAWARPDIDLWTGVYWSKAWPTAPYIWRGMQRGPFLDWKLGEVFRVEQAGVDCLLVRLSDRVKALGPEWFSTEWLWNADQDAPDALATEDFYFYTRCREAGIELWCDTQVQCLHEDRQSGMLFGLTQEMPQVADRVALLPEPGTPLSPDQVVVADVGCGDATPWFGPPATTRVVRFDGDERVKPDFRCDLRDLPVPDQSFDLVHARHVLEHFGRAEAPRALAEWCRILRVGGELRIGVPNLLDAIRKIEDQEALPEGQHADSPYHWWQVYGEQKDAADLHQNGFTPRRLKGLLGLQPGLDDVRVEVVDDGLNLAATARKVAHAGHYALAPAWERLVREGKADMPGLAIEESGSAAAPKSAAPEAETPAPPAPAQTGTAAQAARLIGEALPADKCRNCLGYGGIVGPCATCGVSSRDVAAARAAPAPEGMPV